jgi:hypothetical protein
MSLEQEDETEDSALVRVLLEQVGVELPQSEER